MSASIRYVDMRPWIVISTIRYIKNNKSLDYMIDMIIEKECKLYHIDEFVEKILDISTMPDYIKEDWIFYNKKELKLEDVEKHIERCKNLPNYGVVGDNIFIKEEALNKLLVIKRDFTINNILN